MESETLADIMSHEVLILMQKVGSIELGWKPLDSDKNHPDPSLETLTQSKKWLKVAKIRQIHP